jgi:hypothetical protein
VVDRNSFLKPASVAEICMPSFSHISTLEDLLKPSFLFAGSFEVEKSSS